MCSSSNKKWNISNHNNKTKYLKPIQIKIKRGNKLSEDLHSWGLLRSRMDLRCRILLRLNLYKNSFQFVFSLHPPSRDLLRIFVLDTWTWCWSISKHFIFFCKILGYGSRSSRFKSCSAASDMCCEILVLCLAMYLWGFFEYFKIWN